MEQSQPQGLSRGYVERLLREAKDYRSAASRIEALSRRFLGHPYESSPLVGSVDESEVFTASFDGFDCVTYIETILALAYATTVDDFSEWLRRIRYEHGRIQWKRRNHYMTVWIRNNVRGGIIAPVSLPAVPRLSRERVLDVVAGLSAQRTRVKCAPKLAVLRRATDLRSGDLIFFVSTRKNLDVFHTGIIIRDDKSLVMRHASRSQGGVVEQNLSEFLKANRMTGVIVMRPR